MSTIIPNRVCFGSAPPPPRPVAAPAPAPAGNDDSFIQSFEALCQPSACRAGSPKITEFIQAWAKNPFGAITTFGKVVEKTKEKLGKNPIAETLSKFLSYARQEYALLSGDEIRTQFPQEFTGLARRNDDETATAQKFGLAKTEGFFRAFFSTLDKPGVRDKMLASVQAVKTEH